MPAAEPGVLDDAVDVGGPGQVEAVEALLVVALSPVVAARGWLQINWSLISLAL